MGVARASTQDVAVTKVAPEGTEIRRFDDDASAMQALMSGQVDAIGCSTTVAAQIAKRVPATPSRTSSPCASRTWPWPCARARTSCSKT